MGSITIFLSVAAVVLMVASCEAAGNCPLPSKVYSCSPKCVQDYECSHGKVCCTNGCNAKSCVEPAAYGGAGGSGGSSKHGYAPQKSQPSHSTSVVGPAASLLTMLVPRPFQYSALNKSSTAFVNNFEEMTSPCLTPRCDGMGLFADSILGRIWSRLGRDISSPGCIANQLGIAAGTQELTRFQPSQRLSHSPQMLNIGADYTLRSSVYMSHCVDVVYGGVSAPKSSLFRWLEFAQCLRKMVRDYSPRLPTLKQQYPHSL